MTLSDKQDVFLGNQATLIDYIRNVLKLKVTATWLGRDKAKQAELVRKGLSKTMKSNHLTNTAIDLNIFMNGRILNHYKKDDLTKDEWITLTKIGMFWENLDKINRWGGFFESFYDPGHFEMNVN